MSNVERNDGDDDTYTERGPRRPQMGGPGVPRPPGPATRYQPPTTGHPTITPQMQSQDPSYGNQGGWSSDPRSSASQSSQNQYPNAQATNQQAGAYTSNYGSQGYGAPTSMVSPQYSNPPSSYEQQPASLTYSSNNTNPTYQGYNSNTHSNSPAAYQPAGYSSNPGYQAYAPVPTATHPSQYPPQSHTAPGYNPNFAPQGQAPRPSVPTPYLPPNNQGNYPNQQQNPRNR